ncbi:hypothetical protein [Streptomyces rubiginosohelvolus]|uniref:hypothetical protein n=1 Tax=Streptomyces rubiginosohelvolus TaxID=67362 RepID=UPI0033A0783E
MADQTQEAIDARYEVGKALKGLIYGPHYNNVTPEVQRALLAALEALEESEDTPTEPLDETPTVCASRECGRTRPRWTMELVGGAWSCSPQYAMNCGQCCAPGEYMVHYTEEEHAHQDAPHANCVRCGRDVPRRFLASLIEREGGGLACSPLDPVNMAKCQRIVEALEVTYPVDLARSPREEKL